MQNESKAAAKAPSTWLLIVHSVPGEFGLDSLERL